MPEMKTKFIFLLLTMLVFPLQSFSYSYDSVDGDGIFNSEDNPSYASNYQSDDGDRAPERQYSDRSQSTQSTHHPAEHSLMPSQIDPPGEPVVIVDPRLHRFGAYDSSGTLVRSGLASAGKNYCPDTHQPCRTHVGSFRVFAMGDEDCYSTRFPIPKGGAPMPFCMYFSNNQALHGSYELGNANLSHGCVRLRVSDARWLRYNFVDNGTLVVIKPY